MIQFHGVHKWFKDLHVLNDVNLHVKQGEVVVVCGPSGSGNRPLSVPLTSWNPFKKGKLVVDGKDISDPKTDINRLRAEIGFVFQQFNLYPHLSVLKNITLAPIKIRKIPKERRRNRPRPFWSGSASPKKRGCLSLPALRRSAAAGRHRPRSGHETEDHAL